MMKIIILRLLLLLLVLVFVVIVAVGVVEYARLPPWRQNVLSTCRIERCRVSLHPRNAVDRQPGGGGGL